MIDNKTIFAIEWFDDDINSWCPYSFYSTLPMAVSVAEKASLAASKHDDAEWWDTNYRVWKYPIDRELDDPAEDCMYAVARIEKGVTVYT